MSFDTLAPHYRWMEFVLAGNKLQRCRTAFLKDVANARDVLICGEGNGRFLVECRRRLPRARITCVDASPRMLEAARTRLARQDLFDPNIEFLLADILQWDSEPARFDLIVTHFFLDCFRPEQLAGVVSALATSTRAGAAWLLADFQIPVSSLSRLRALACHWLMYRFFRLTTALPARKLTAPDPFLARNGFSLRDRRESEWGLLHTDLWRKAPAIEH